MRFLSIITLIFSLLFYTAVLSTEQTAYPPVEAEVLDQWHNDASAAINAQEAYLQGLFRRSWAHFDPSYRIEIERVTTDLEVKTILANDFFNADELRSDLVREKTLEVFRKLGLTPGDLAHLRQVVQSERIRMAVWDAEQLDQADLSSP